MLGAGVLQAQVQAPGRDMWPSNDSVDPGHLSGALRVRRRFLRWCRHQEQ